MGILQKKVYQTYLVSAMYLTSWNLILGKNTVQEMVPWRDWNEILVSPTQSSPHTLISTINHAHQELKPQAGFMKLNVPWWQSSSWILISLSLLVLCMIGPGWSISISSREALSCPVSLTSSNTHIQRLTHARYCMPLEAEPHPSLFIRKILKAILGQMFHDDLTQGSKKVKNKVCLFGINPLSTLA